MAYDPHINKTVNDAIHNAGPVLYDLDGLTASRTETAQVREIIEQKAQQISSEIFGESLPSGFVERFADEMMDRRNGMAFSGTNSVTEREIRSAFEDAWKEHYGHSLEEARVAEEVQPDSAPTEPPEMESVAIEPEDLPDIKPIDVAKNPEANITDIEAAYRETAAFGASSFRSEYFKTLEGRVDANGTLNDQEVKLVAEMFEDAEYPGSRERDELGEDLMEAYFKSNAPSEAFTEMVSDAYGDMTWFENRDNVREAALEQFMELNNPSAEQIAFMSRIAEKMSKDEQAQLEEHMESLQADGLDVDADPPVTLGILGAEDEAEASADAEKTESTPQRRPSTDENNSATATTVLATGAAGATGGASAAVGSGADNLSFGNYDFSSMGGIFQAIMDLLSRFFGGMKQETAADPGVKNAAEANGGAANAGTGGGKGEPDNANAMGPEDNLDKDDSEDPNANPGTSDADQEEEPEVDADVVTALTDDQPETVSDEPEATESKPETEEENLEVEKEEPELNDEPELDSIDIPEVSENDLDLLELVDLIDQMLWDPSILPADIIDSPEIQPEYSLLTQQLLDVQAGECDFCSLHEQLTNFANKIDDLAETRDDLDDVRQNLGNAQAQLEQEMKDQGIEPSDPTPSDSPEQNPELEQTVETQRSIPVGTGYITPGFD